MTLQTFTPCRTRAILAVAALACLLSACGGGADEAPVDEGPVSVGFSDTTEDRRFTLWAPGEAQALLLEQRAADPLVDEGTVQLIVRLNPAAVFSSGRMALLGGAGNGETGDAAALRASQLAAKVNAVATAAEAVVARSVLQVAPQAVVRQQFSHAVEGFVLSVPWSQAEAVAAELARNPAVDAVEPDRRFSVEQTTTAVRTLDARAWGVDRIDQRSRVFDSAFRHSRNGAGVNVYVLDTGVNGHSEFGTRLASGFSAINDGRGSSDCHGHGTHVAGIAAGATLGVAPGSRVVPVRVLDCSGSSSGSSVLQGLDWVAAQGVRPAVVNISLGGGVSTTLDSAVQRLVTTGFNVVAAAGNSNIDACTQSPGRAAGLITVAASDRNDAKAGFSNWGSCVALWAPGTGIASAGAGSATAVVAMNGTSMAAPHAAGAVALLLQAQPTLAPAQVRQQMLARASANAVSGTPGTMTRSLLFAGEEGGAMAVPAVSTVSVRSLSMSTQVPSIGSWRAAAEVLIVDEAGRPVAGAQVAGRYSNASKDVACTTGAAGTCTLLSAVSSWSKVPVLGAAIAGVKGTKLAYAGGGQRSAQVTRPAAPQAQVAALTGTQLRAKPTAVEWTPQFAVVLKDERGALVVNATVLATMQAHMGSGVVAARSVSCRTGKAGDCKLSWNGTKLNASHSGAAVQVLDVQRDFLGYQPGAIRSASVGRIH